jgi:hypothetical protein
VFSSPIVYAWIAWLLVVGVIAVLRFVAHQREARRRAERRSQHQIGPVVQSVPGNAPKGNSPKTIRRRPIPADYREQLVAAGIIQPAPDLTTPDPATQV